MKYVITGSVGHISKPLVENLVKAGHDVTVISSKNNNRSVIEQLGAKAIIGSVEDVDFLKQAFSNADAVYTMVPPNFGAANWKEWIGSIGNNYASAIAATGIQHIVNLSSVGAHLPEGCGPVSGLYFAEQALNKLAGVHVKHLRPGFFYHNFLANIGMIQHMNLIGGNYGDASTNMVLVNPADIAAVAAEELLNLQFTGKSVRYIASDERTTGDIAQILGTAIGKPDLPWINFSDEDTLKGMLQAGLPEEIAKNYTEMGIALRNGSMTEDYYKNKPVLSNTKLESFANVFAQAYHQSINH
ncbi:MAG: NmrA family NAD(P)-binding protein [Sphingobacteriia bacterium]|nr:NmrA family NAD(P)-binding protein [Sphingobacteriia bacterium]